MDKEKRDTWVYSIIISLAILSYGTGLPNLGHFIMFLVVYSKLYRIEDKIKELYGE